MKCFAASVFLVLYLVAMFRPVQPLLDYWLRFDYYKNELCMNRTRPELNCNGQCILMQRLKQAADTQQGPVNLPTSQRVNLEDYPIGIVEIEDLLKISFTELNTFFGAIVFFKPSSFSVEVFHPPAS